ncbi:molybdenum cofactor guanylyltransferase [Microbacterium sp. CIAB417]|uniref:molybdenum cofactor guanylyltransferase n=1 Tax=Microbacterium sp. CIAB417 TaxID=2860287 RepID=UPI001FAE2BE7|nr:NTP transferase domain-containing protein [Microbacterium sp. CIAB417]
MNAAPRRAAVILAGGRATRLGGADKAEVEIGGRMLIDIVVLAVSGCDPVIVAGPEHLARTGVRVVREDPPFGGPVAAIAAAVAELPADVEETWLLACDLPNAAGVVDLLSRAELPADADAVVLRDAQGRAQPLAGRYRAAALRRAVAALDEVDGSSMRRLSRGLRVHEIDDPAGASADLDTWDDIAAFRGDSPAEDAGRWRRETA